MTKLSLQFILIFNVFVSAFISAAEVDHDVSRRALKMECNDVGICVNCAKSEMGQDYCKDSGRKIRTICSDPSGSGKEIEDYRACWLTPEDDQVRVILFQIAMAIMGGLAFYIVQDRKQKLMSLYDNRKLGRRPPSNGDLTRVK